MPKVCVTCEECELHFFTWPYRIREGIRFCSRQCKAAASRGMPAANRAQLAGQKFGSLTVIELHGTDAGHTVWQCLCQCGRTTNVRDGNLQSGAVRSCGCLIYQRGAEHPNWRRGFTITSEGYKRLLLSDDTREKRYEAEHRLVMAEALGRTLDSDEIVHHINRVRTDNRLENLVVLSREEHAALHAAEDRRCVAC